jgi:LysM repeat protein
VWQSRPQTPISEQPTNYYAPEDDYPPPTASAPQPDRFWQRFVLLLLLVFILTSGGAIVTSYALFQQSETIFPAVSAVGVNLGGLTQTQAEAALAQVAQTPTIQVQAGQTTQLISLAELGYSLDTQVMAIEAYSRGRTLANWRELPLAFLLGAEVPPTWQFAETTAHTTLNELAIEAHIPPVSPDLVYSHGQVTISSGQPGSQLDVTAALAWLAQQSPNTLAGRALTLPMIPEEPVAVGLAEQAAAANEHLSRTLTVLAYDPITDERLTWSLAPETWNQWVIARRVSDSPTGFVFSLASNAVQDYFLLKDVALPASQYLQADEAAANLLAAYDNGSWNSTVRIYHNEQEHIVQAGETLSSIARDYGMPYPWLEQANPGLTGLYAGQSILIPSPDLFLPLPVVEHKRIIISLSQQKMWAYENGNLQWEWVVSTGIAESPTSPGVYQVQTHVDNAYAGNWDLWMPYFIGIYRPVPTSDFMNGFHGFPTRGNSQLLWTNSLGRPVTYGCVLVSDDNAAALYQWAEAGVVVEIQP